VAEEPAGVLALYADSPGFFDSEDEMRLLLELAGDIAFALEHIEKAGGSTTSPTRSATELANATLFRAASRAIRGRSARGRAQARPRLVDVDRSRPSTIRSARPAGDELLKQIARRISEYVKDRASLPACRQTALPWCSRRSDREDDGRAAHRARLANASARRSA